MSYLTSWNYSEDGSGIEIRTTSKHPFFAHSQKWKKEDGGTPTACQEDSTVAHLRLLCPPDRFAASWKEWRSQERCHSYRTQDALPERGESFSSGSRSISPRSAFSKDRAHPVGSTMLHINGDQWACVEDSSSSSDYEEDEEDDVLGDGEGEWDEKGDESTSFRSFSPHSEPSHGALLKLANEVVYDISFFSIGGRSGTPPAVFQTLIEALEDGTIYLQQSQPPGFPVSFLMEDESNAKPSSLSTFFSFHFLFLGFNESNSTVVLLPEPILYKTVEKGKRQTKDGVATVYAFYPLPLVEIPESHMFLLLPPFAQKVVPASAAPLHSGVAMELLPGVFCRVPMTGGIFPSSSSSLETKADPHSTSNHEDRVLWSPFLNVDLLSRVFHVIPEREYYLSSIHRDVVFLGVCCGLPWIQYRISPSASSSGTPLGCRSSSGNTSGAEKSMDVMRSSLSSPAVPLTLCYYHKDLMQRYGLCEEKPLALSPARSNRPVTAEGDAPSSSSLGDPNGFETSPHRHTGDTWPSSEASSLQTPHVDLPLETTPMPPPTTSLIPSHSSASSSFSGPRQKVAPRLSSLHSPFYHTASTAHPTVTVTGPYGTPIHCTKDARALYGVHFPNRILTRAGVSAATWSRLMGDTASSHCSPLGEHKRPSPSHVRHEDEAIRGGMEATVMGLFHHALVLLFDGHSKACILRSGISRQEFTKAFSLVPTTTAAPSPVIPPLPHEAPPPAATNRDTEEKEDMEPVGVVLDVAESGQEKIEQEEGRTTTVTSSENGILGDAQQDEPEQREETSIPSPDMAPPAVAFSVKEDSPPSSSRETSSTERAVSLPNEVSDQERRASETSTSPGTSGVQSALGEEEEVSSSRTTTIIAAGGAATPLINFLKGFATMKLESERVEDVVDTKEKPSLQQLTQYYCRSLDHLLYAHQRYAYYTEHVESAVDFFSRHTPKEIQAFLLDHET